MILPSLCISDTGSCVLLGRNLASLFRMEGIDTAVCTDPGSRFFDVSFYPSVSPPRFHQGSPGTTPEEYHAYYRSISASVLKKDFKRIQEAIEEWEPDLLIELERPAAIAAAKHLSLPVLSIVSASMFRNRNFKPDILKGLNRFLNNADMEQVLHLRELYDYTQCFAFGPAGFLPRFGDYEVTAFGTSCIPPADTAITKELSILFTESRRSDRSLRQMIIDAFLGAPYEVYAASSGFHPGKQSNIRFQNNVRLSSLNGSRIVIHDGCDAVTQYCTAMGVMQIIVYDDSCQRSWNAACLKRSGAGLTIPESLLSMETMYETYRRILADDSFRINAQQLRTEVLEKGDLSSILPHL